MIKKLITGLVVIIVILCVVVVTRPDDFTITRSASIAAPPLAVFEQVNNFHKWNEWSPWARLDPNCKITYEGAFAGEGAIYKWAGNSEVGEGKQTIVESRPGELVRIKLEFIKPFPGANDVEFTFKTQGTHTLTTWSMSGKWNFMTKAIGLFMDCDKMVGGYFEKGLASIKAIVEAPKA